MRYCPFSPSPSSLSFVSILSLGLLISVSGCEKKASSHKPPPQKVLIETLKPQAANIEISLPGRTEAYKQAQIRPQVSGIIVQRLFEQGMDIQKGQQLYQIYIAPFQAAYDQAYGKMMESQASALRAHAQLRRYKELVKTHAVSNQDYDNSLATAKEADAQLLQAKAQVESARVNLKYTHVYAPISGRIGRTLYTEGTLVTANQSQSIAVVTQLDPIYVDVNLAAEDMLRLKKALQEGRLKTNGSDAAVKLELPDGSLFSQIGRLELSEVTVDEGTGTLVMRALMPNPDHLLLPGMYVHARIEEGSEPTALLIPQVALQRTLKAEPYVMVLDDKNRVHQRIITLGEAVGTQWIVRSGLQAGEKIVINGLQKIRPEAIVNPQETTSQAPLTQAK